MAVVGSAWVEIKPLTTGFGPETEAQVKRALAGVVGRVELELDATGFRQRVEAVVQAATAGIRPEIEIDVDIAGLRQRVELALLGIRSEIDLDVDIIGLRQRIDAALAGIRTRIDLDVNATALRAAIRSATSGVKLTLDVNAAALRAAVRAAVQGVKLDLDVLVGALRSKIRAAVAGLKVNIDIEFDAARLRARLAAVLASVSGTKIDIDFDIDVVALRRKIAAAVRAASTGQSIDLGLAGGGFGGGSGFSNLRSALAGLAVPALDAIVGGLAAITAALVGAAGAAFAFAGSLGSIVGAAAALPAALSSVLQGITVIGLALGGVGDALKAATAAEKAVSVAAAGGAASAAASVAQARAVEAARRGVADAERQAAVAAEQSARRIEDAGLSLARAQRIQQRAQEDLNRARRQAIEDLEDLRLAVQRLDLDERRARERLRVAQIRASLEERRAVGDLRHLTEEAYEELLRQATENPRLEAALDLADAEQDLREILERQQDARQELNAAERAGVEGADIVVAAKERLLEADEAAAEAARDLADAQRDAARSQEDSARRIQEAQERLADALETTAGGADAASGAMDRYQAALDRLGPSQRRFVEFLLGLRPLINDLQETAAAGLFPGIQAGLEQVLPLVDDFKPIIFDTGRAIGELTQTFAILVSSPSFRSDLIRFGRGNIEIIRLMGDASISAADAMRHLSLAGQPLATRLAGVTAAVAELLAGQLRVARGDGSLDAYFRRVGDRIEDVVLTVFFLGSALVRAFDEASDAGDEYLDLLLRLSARLDLIVERASRSGTLRAFFEESRPAVHELGALIRDVVSTLFNIGRGNFDTFIVASQAIREFLLPSLERLAEELDGRSIASLARLLSTVIDLYTNLIAGNPIIRGFVSALTEILDVVRFLATEIPILSPLLVGLVGAMIAIRSAVSLARLTSFILGISVLQGIVPAARAALANLAGTIAVLFQRMGLGTMAALNLTGALLGIGAVAAGILLVKVAIDQIAPSMDKATQAIIGASDPLAEFEKQVRKATDPGWWDLLTADIKRFFSGDLKTQMAVWRGELNNLGTTTIGMFRDLAQQSPVVAQQIIKDMQAQGRATGDYQKVLDDVIARVAVHGVTEDEVRAKIDAARQAISGKTDAQKEYINSLQTINDLLVTQSNAEIASRDALDRLTASVQENGANFDINTAKGRENLRLRNDLISALGREVESLVDSAAKGLLDVAAKDALIERLRNLTHSQYPGVAQAAQNYLNIIFSIPENVNTYVNIHTAEAQAAIQHLINEFGFLQSTAEITVKLFGVENAETAIRGLRSDAGNIFGPEERQHGGRVHRGRAYIVGEKRPELFVPDDDGMIFPQVPPVREGVRNQIAAAVEDIAVRVDLEMVPRLAPVEGPATDAFTTTASIDALVDALRSLERTLAEGLGGGGSVDQPVFTDEDRQVVFHNTFVLPPGSNDPEAIAAAVERRILWQLGSPSGGGAG